MTSTSVASVDENAHLVQEVLEAAGRWLAVHEQLSPLPPTEGRAGV